ncbi:MAG: YHS domain-containing protein [Candidatus Bathyarchaeota archaeon]|nr:YHS domain-containing protein [Candidatus Bathyarchaeota archaeon]
MEVGQKSAEFKTERMGKTYYFYAPGCKKAFDSNPQGFIKK